MRYRYTLVTEMAEGSQLKPAAYRLAKKGPLDSDTGEEMDPHSEGEESGREDDFMIEDARTMIMNYENGFHLKHREHFPERFKPGSNARKSNRRKP